MPNQKVKRFSKGKSFHPSFRSSVQASASAGTSASAECGGSLHGEPSALHDHSYAYPEWLIPKNNEWTLDQLKARFQLYEERSIKIEASLEEKKPFIHFIFKCKSEEILKFRVCFKITTNLVIGHSRVKMCIQCVIYIS
eukprot:GHVP01067874.1.p1 GENE.GHVP01067874.1~~GHVP01067874.1.p1  ORF type:complete len:139 (+),score=12.89 GHVP01067874.1:1-417(+)